jgi:hypothetical protein
VLFREAIRRLARVIYENTAFYDPIRGEHRDVAFGFLKYSLPLTPPSSRAWRFVWDQQFFEFCKATGGGLWFDLETYRKLDFASRRLFVFLQKVFHRSPVSPALDTRRLCVDVLGFSPTIKVNRLKEKLVRCVERLAAEGIVELPAGGCKGTGFFVKHDVGQYSIVLHRGPYFSRKKLDATKLPAEESALVDPLRTIGLDDHATTRVLRDYPADMIREWADITLAARERNGESFFKKSAAAYFIDNVQHASAGRRTAPDWWRELRLQEFVRQHEEDSEQMKSVGERREEEAFRSFLAGEARDAFVEMTRRVAQDLVKRGKPQHDAEESAEYMTRLHFLNQFRRAHGQPSRN